jgi:hypothetical protein
MPSGTFRLKGAALLERFHKRGFDNHHRISLQARVTYPTVKSWLQDEPEVESLHLPSLAGLLVDGLGMTPDEALSLRLRDLLEYLPVNGGAK